MKNIILLLLFTFVLTSSIFSSQRKALVEVFTNSHCSICPGAHTSLKNYVQTNSNAENVRFIYYHMVYPYSDDPLNQHNTV
ncbi:MAG: hypothetical protein KGZ58_08015, partial [Ignavibacteriales bacterium]|nr:hypothetical protein [Ignavibacteriales bacterium]